MYDVLTSENKIKGKIRTVFNKLRDHFRDAIEKVTQFYPSFSPCFVKILNYAERFHVQAGKLYYDYVKICNSGIAECHRF